MTHRRAEPGRRFSSRVALPLLFLDEAGRAPIRPPSGRLRPVSPSPPVAHRHALPPRRLPCPPTRPRSAAQWRKPLRTPADPFGGPWRCWAMSAPGAGSSIPSRSSTASIPRAARSNGRVLEVSNTPWHERCSYVVGPPGEHRFAKAMHVSPFLPAEGTYTLRYTAPEERIRVSLDVDAPTPSAPYRREHEPSPDTPPPQLSASMVLRRRPLDRAGLARLLWGYPLDDGARVRWHLRPGAAAGRARRADPPAPRPAGGRGRARGLPGRQAPPRGPAMSQESGRLVLGLAQRSSRGRPGTLRFEGSGLPGARPMVSGSGRPGRHRGGARPEDVAGRVAPRLARHGRELHGGVVGRRRPHRRRPHRVPPDHDPSAVPRCHGATLRWPGGRGATAPSTEQAS